MSNYFSPVWGIKQKSQTIIIEETRLISLFQTSKLFGRRAVFIFFLISLEIRENYSSRLYRALSPDTQNQQRPLL